MRNKLEHLSEEKEDREDLPFFCSNCHYTARAATHEVVPRAAARAVSTEMIMLRIHFQVSFLFDSLIVGPFSSPQGEDLSAEGMAVLK